MDPDLAPIKAAPAERGGPYLHALIEATQPTLQHLAPGLMAWLEAACDWELNRRQGVDYDLRRPEAAIPPEEDAVSIDVAIALRVMFADDSSAGVRALFDALVELLTGGGRRH